MIPSCRWVVMAGAVLAAWGGRAAASDAPLVRGPAPGPAAYTFRPADALLPADKTDSPATFLFSGVSYRLAGDGAVEATTHEVVRVNGRKGVAAFGEYRTITHTPAYETLTLHTARVHKSDGRAVDAGPADLHTRDLPTDYLSYDPARHLVISWPGLEPGDVIEAHWTTRGRNPEHGGQLFHRYTFGSDEYPVLRDELRVRLPAGVSLKHATVRPPWPAEPAAPTFSLRDEDGGTLHTWAARDLSPPPSEEHLPPADELRTSVAFSTFADWAAVGRWKWQLREHCRDCPPDLSRLVAEVTAGATGPADKARALTQWVRRNVRYLSAGDRHDFTPHPPALVLRQRRGDCKDQCQLLAVMLKAAGVAAELVTLGVRGDGDVVPEVPSPFGTHALVRVTLGGAEHWVDPTFTGAAWDQLPEVAAGRACYLVGENGVSLARTPALGPSHNRLTQIVTVAVGPDGSACVSRHTRHAGLAAVSKRDEWSEVPADRLTRKARVDLANHHADARHFRFRVDRAALDDPDAPAAADTAYELPAHFSGEDVRRGTLTDNAVWGPLLSVTLDDDRDAPADVGPPFESVFRCTVRIPPGWRFDELPEDAEEKSPWGRCVLKVRAPGADDDPRELSFEVTTTLSRTRVEPGETEQFREFQDAVTDMVRVSLSLRELERPDRDDLRLLEALHRLAPGDTDAGQTLARLYDAAGRQREAGRVRERLKEFESATD